MNLDIYTEEMSKSIWDKAFFIDKIPGAKCVIDFGCADGAVTNIIKLFYPTGWRNKGFSAMILIMNC